MATTSTTSCPWPFLRLPASIRKTIYAHLLTPHPEEDVTTINYDLRWNWLENPSNTTFAGAQQIDLCRCPQQQQRTHNAPTEDHIYTRYKCHGPEVRFKSAREDLWMLSADYARSGQINFLSPATASELRRRPNANILSTCKMVYQEAVPFLYRGRNLLFLSGPCPRGRYQAYATQNFLTRLTHLARSHITTLSIIALNYEEDCRVDDVGGAYFNLAAYIEQSLVSFRTLCFNLWDERLKDLACLLCGVFLKSGTSICLGTDPVSGSIVECKDPHSYAVALRRVAADMRRVALNDGEHQTCVKNNDGKEAGRNQVQRVWEEVDADEDVPEVHPRSKPEAWRRHRLRRTVKFQGGSSRVRGLQKEKAKQDVQEEEEDEWVDATLSPGSVNSWREGDEDNWELL